MRPFRTLGRRLAPLFLTFLLGPCLVYTSAMAEDAAGQADLDAATSLKLNASSMADLERVIELTESALEKGLPADSESLAKSLITASLFQHGSRFAQALFDPRERTERPAMLKQFALKDLYSILEYDDTLPQVHMMIARLEGVNVGTTITPENFAKGRNAADRAIKLLEEDKPMQSKALVLRAGYEGTNSEARIALLDKAVEADNNNTDAWRLRGKTRLVQGEMLSAEGKLEESQKVREKAVADFTRLLEENPDDPDALQTVAELLGRLGDFEKAMEYANQALEKNPRVFSLYLLRARLYHKQGEHDFSIQDLNKALDIQPDSFLAYLDRAEVNYDKGDMEAAAKDYGKTRKLQANLPSIILQRMMIRSQNDTDKAIAEVEKFLELDELDAKENNRKVDPEFRLQLGQTYTVLKKYAKVVDLLSPLLASLDPESDSTRIKNARFLALRTRADAYLSLGEHSKAVGDYREAKAIIPKNDGVLNNLAWVLSTSPKDGIRNAEDAISLAKEACEVTQYKQPHILSTLAASYAESGDFELAKKYSSQAVEMAQDAPEPDEEMVKQLQAELDSYKAEKPWRELQSEDSESDSGEEETEDQNVEEEKSEEEVLEPAGVE